MLSVWLKDCKHCRRRRDTLSGTTVGALRHHTNSIRTSVVHAQCRIPQLPSSLMKARFTRDDNEDRNALLLARECASVAAVIPRGMPLPCRHICS